MKAIAATAAGWLGGDRGTVTAEFAAALPAAVLVMVLSVAAVQASALQIRVVDAASVAARTVARGEETAAADARVGRLVGDHDLSTSSDGDFVCATVSAPVLFGALGVAGIRVSAQSCALAGGK